MGSESSITSKQHDFTITLTIIAENQNIRKIECSFLSFSWPNSILSLLVTLELEVYQTPTHEHYTTLPVLTSHDAKGGVVEAAVGGTRAHTHTLKKKNMHVVNSYNKRCLLCQNTLSTILCCKAIYIYSLFTGFPGSSDILKLMFSNYQFRWNHL